MVSLRKLSLGNSRNVNGYDFPLAYELDANEESLKDTDAVAEFLKKTAENQFFNEALQKHGAIVIRNTGTKDPAVLSKYVNALGTGSGGSFFVQNGSTAQRTEITDILTTANEGPSSTYIHQHNEFSRFTVFPRRLFFVCSEYGPGTEGGETPIVHGAEFFDALKERVPELLNRLGKEGLYYEQTWHKVSNNKTSWSDYFCFGRNIEKNDSLVEAKNKAEEIIKKHVSNDFHWTEADDLVVGQHSKPIRICIDPETGEEVPTIFSSITTYYHASKQENYHTPTKPLLYDSADKEQISDDWLDVVMQTAYDISYKHSWKEGDIAIVDNYQVSHGRCPWSNGPRKILVSMWDDLNKKEYGVWNRAV